MSKLPVEDDYKRWVKQIDELLIDMKNKMPKFMFNGVYGSMVYVRAKLRNFQNLKTSED